jgi:hypothetical protein
METGMSNEVIECRGVAERFLQALISRDFRAIEACFRPDIPFRALVPPGLREASDATGAVAHVRRWFGDADSWEVEWAEVGSVVDRAAVAYRIRLHEPDG